MLPSRQWRWFAAAGGGAANCPAVGLAAALQPPTVRIRNHAEAKVAQPLSLPPTGIPEMAGPGAAGEAPRRQEPIRHPPDDLWAPGRRRGPKGLLLLGGRGGCGLDLAFPAGLASGAGLPSRRHTKWEGPRCRAGHLTPSAAPFRAPACHMSRHASSRLAEAHNRAALHPNANIGTGSCAGGRWSAAWRPPCAQRRSCLQLGSAAARGTADED